MGNLKPKTDLTPARLSGQTIGGLLVTLFAFAVIVAALFVVARAITQ